MRDSLLVLKKGCGAKTTWLLCNKEPHRNLSVGQGMQEVPDDLLWDTVLHTPLRKTCVIYCCTRNL
jgi:hypothetical protein